MRPIALVVDDDALQRPNSGKVLDGDKYRIIFAADGVEVLYLLRKTRPDIILMDVMMPLMDGIEAVRRIRMDPQLATLPIIMMTGKSENHVVIDCIKAGANDFVVKPIDRDTLMNKLAFALID